MKVLFVGDPIASLKPLGDSSMAFMLEALALKDEVYYASAEDLYWENTSLIVSASRVQNFKKFELPALEKAGRFEADDFDQIHIRKDPPFDSSYVKLCWLLATQEKTIRIINSPSTLLRYHEKLMQIEALTQGFIEEKDLIPHLITSKPEVALDFMKNSKAEKFILKPFLGFGGNSIQVLEKSSVLKKPELLGDLSDSILQPFDAEVLTKGDRRVFFIQGEYRGDFVRIPAKGSVVSNLAQGGSAEIRDLSDTEKKLVKKVESFLQTLKIDIAGADFINGKLNEINITSPTGFLTFEKLYRKNLAKEFILSLR